MSETVPLIPHAGLPAFTLMAPTPQSARRCQELLSRHQDRGAVNGRLGVHARGAFHGKALLSQVRDGDARGDDATAGTGVG